MLRRILYLLSYFCILWAFFLMQKPILMLADAAKSYTFTNFLQVMWHGAALDASISAWLTVFPLIMAFVSVWYRHIPFRKILTPYYIIVVLMSSLAFFSYIVMNTEGGMNHEIPSNIGFGIFKEVFGNTSDGGIILRLSGIILSTAVVSFILYWATPQRMPKINMLDAQLLNTFWIIPLGGILYIIGRGGLGTQTISSANTAFSDDNFLNRSAINPMSCLFLLPKGNISQDITADNIEQQQLSKQLNELYPKSNVGTRYVLTTSRPNVLLVIMPNFGSAFIKALGGKPDVAPNLNALSKNGIFFSRCFANGITINAGLTSILGGYPGISDKTMPTLPGALSKMGYKTNFFYGGDLGKTEVEDYINRAGFLNVRSIASLPDTPSSEKKGGINDAEMFDYLYNKLTQQTTKGSWFTTVLMSGQADASFHRFKDKVYNTFAYTDDCIGNFIAKFKKTPQWKNTLIVFVADRGMDYPHRKDKNVTRLFRIPMIWTGGAVSYPMEYKKIMNQSDMVATLLAQLGISHKNFSLSRNVLSTSYKDPFAFYHLNDGFGFSDNTGISVYNTASDKVVYEVYPNQERIRKGKAIFKWIYFK